MFWPVFLFELRRWLKRPATAVLTLLFLGLGFLAMQIILGAIDRFRVVMVFGGEALNFNSPFVLQLQIGILTLLGIIVTAALVGGAFHQDSAHRMEPLLWTTRLTRRAHWMGRFSAAALVNLMILLGVAMGLWLGTLAPWIDSHLIGPNLWLSYVYPYLITVLPRVLLAGAAVAFLVTKSRSLLPGYIVTIIMTAGFFVSRRLLGDLENRTLAALLDPSGGSAWGLITRYWTTVEKNTLVAPLEGVFLANRSLWLAVAVVIFLIGLRFHRPDLTREGKSPLGRLWTKLRLGARIRSLGGRIMAPVIGRLPLTLKLSALETQGILGHPVFLVTTLIGVLVLWASSSSVTRIFGTTTWPVTYSVVEGISGLFSLFAIGLLIFFSGHTIGLERRQRMDQILDALPGSVWRPLLAKLIAMIAVLAVMQSVLIGVGLFFQMRQGYDRYELDLYIQALLGIQLVDYVLILVLAFFLQVLLKSEVLGYIATILAFFAINN